MCLTVGPAEAEFLPRALPDVTKPRTTRFKSPRPPWMSAEQVWSCGGRSAAAAAAALPRIDWARAPAEPSGVPVRFPRGRAAYVGALYSGGGIAYRRAFRSGLYILQYAGSFYKGDLADACGPTPDTPLPLQTGVLA